LQTKFPFQLSERSLCLLSTCTQRPTNHFLPILSFLRPYNHPRLCFYPLSLHILPWKIRFLSVFLCHFFFYHSQNSSSSSFVLAHWRPQLVLLNYYCLFLVTGFWVICVISGLHWPIYAYWVSLA
jgi:hypothetical protein